MASIVIKKKAVCSVGMAGRQAEDVRGRGKERKRNGGRGEEGNRKKVKAITALVMAVVWEAPSRNMIKSVLIVAGEGWRWSGSGHPHTNVNQRATQVLHLHASPCPEFRCSCPLSRCQKCYSVLLALPSSSSSPP